MQDPPSQQPPLTYLYTREQLQAIAPDREITGQVSFPQTIFYPDRRQVIQRSIILVVCFVVMILCFPFLFILNSLSRGSFFEISDTIPLLLMVAMITFMGWIIWSFISSQLPHARNPLLVINHDGLMVGKRALFSGSFIPWAEIESIYLYTDIFPYYRYLCIRPRNREKFLSLFSRLERIVRQINWRMGAPIAIPEVFLEKSIEEILAQLSSLYPDKLSYYPDHLAEMRAAGQWTSIKQK